MEVPTTAAYVICVSVAGPALQSLGLEPLLAHLFVFWYALLSTITPPVCGTVFVAAGMVGEDWFKVALSAMALGVGLYLVPIAMVANPDLIAFGASPWVAMGAAAKSGVGLIAISYGVIAPSHGLPDSTCWRRLSVLLISSRRRVCVSVPSPVMGILKGSNCSTTGLSGQAMSVPLETRCFP